MWENIEGQKTSKIKGFQVSEKCYYTTTTPIDFGTSV
jgi:hypothetical protein